MNSVAGCAAGRATQISDATELVSGLTPCQTPPTGLQSRPLEVKSGDYLAGVKVVIESATKAQVLELFGATNDRPMLFREGRFFLLHAPGGIIAAYRKCTHLGCAVPWSDAEDRFHCPCHGSEYDKRTAVVLKNPAPRPLQLFHITEDAEGQLIVDTNPLRVIDRTKDDWDPAVIEIADA